MPGPGRSHKPQSNQASVSQLLSLCSRTSSVQSVNRVRRFVTPWTAARQASLSLVSSQVLTHTSTGETQTQFWLSLCRVSGLQSQGAAISEAHWTQGQCSAMRVYSAHRNQTKAHAATKTQHSHKFKKKIFFFFKEQTGQILEACFNFDFFLRPRDTCACLFHMQPYTVESVFLHFKN